MSLPSVFYVALFTVSLFEMHVCFFDHCGCIFDNEDYKHSTIGIFGREIQPLAVNSTDLANIIEIAAEHNSAVIGQYPLNTMHDFIRFHEHYKWVRNNTRGKSISQIFDSYTPDFVRFESVFSLVAEVVLRIVNDQRLKDSFPLLERTIYFATADDINNDNLIKNARYARGESTHLKHNHVAAVIMITLNENGNNAFGYIVIETGLGLKPFYIMGDQIISIPHNHFAPMNITFKLSGRNKQFLVANNELSGQNILYYLGRPFCKMMVKTVKNTLLNVRRSILFRNNLGHPIAEIYVGFYDAYFHMRMQPENVGEPVREATVSVNDVWTIASNYYTENVLARQMFEIFVQYIPHLPQLIDAFDQAAENADFGPVYTLLIKYLNFDY